MSVYQDITFTLRLAQTMAEALEALFKSLSQSHQDRDIYRKNLQTAKELREEFKKGSYTPENRDKLNDLSKNVNATILKSPEATKDILRYFKKNNINCIPMVRAGKNGEKQYAVMFSAEDSKRAQRLINRYNAEYAKGCVSKGVLFNSTTNPQKITGLNQIETLAFMKQADKYNLPIFVEETANNGYTVVFDGNQENKIDYIRAGVSYEMGGPASAIIIAEYEKRINQHNLAVKSLDKSITEGISTFIVDKNGAVMWTDPTNLSLHYRKDDNKFHVDINDKEFSVSVGKLLIGMDHPTVMTDEEYTKFAYLDGKEKEKFRQEVDEKEGSQPLTKQELELLHRHEEKRTLIERKLLRENPGNVAHSLDLTNDHERMAEYDTYNKENIEFAHDEAQETPDAASIYDDAAYNYKHYMPKRDTRDFEQEQDLEKFTNELFKEEEWDHYQYDDRDLEVDIDDINENNILDEQEMDW